MITDLFSHKIHSSGSDWPDKLVELAFLFNEFDGEIFDRAAIEQRLKDISPRSAYAARDPSKFRDEISAYPAYLGLYQLQKSSKGWILRIGETTKKFLVQEQPDVASFMRLQLALFQYPNGMGMRYSQPNRVNIQTNVRDRTLKMVLAGIHLSPLRLICRSLLADAKLRKVSLLDGVVAYSEIFSLANHRNVNRSAAPKIEKLIAALKGIRAGKIKPPPHFESRFHILKHTDLFNINKAGIAFRKPLNESDKIDLEKNIAAILKIESQFDGFDAARTGDDLAAVVASGKWAEYFDGVAVLEGSLISALSSDSIEEPQLTPGRGLVPQPSKKAYALRARQEFFTAPPPSNRTAELADPEVTRIKRQRRNLLHKLLVTKMDQMLRHINAEPKESPHIDLFAKIPEDGSFLFEMKSGGENLLDQIRKGISQLYEYRYRYSSDLGEDVTLCLVLQDEPSEPDWLQEYLCLDRKICICWFDSEGTLKYPEYCRVQLSNLFL